MITHTTDKSFDISGFNYSGTRAFNIRRSAEIARAEYVGKQMRKIGQHLSELRRSTRDLLDFAQARNQASRL